MVIVVDELAPGRRLNQAAVCTECRGLVLDCELVHDDGGRPFCGECADVLVLL